MAGPKRGCKNLRIDEKTLGKARSVPSSTASIRRAAPAGNTLGTGRQSATNALQHSLPTCHDAGTEQRPRTILQLKRKKTTTRPAKSKQRKPTRQPYPLANTSSVGPKLYSRPRSFCCTRLPCTTAWAFHAGTAPRSSSSPVFSAPIFTSPNFTLGCSASDTVPTFPASESTQIVRTCSSSAG